MSMPRGTPAMLDDPEHLNRFLAIIGGTPLATRSATEADLIYNESEAGSGNASYPSSGATTKTGTESNGGSGTGTPEVGSRAPSAASSPARGTRAPPPTPANMPVIMETAPSLEPIDEGQDGTDIFRQLAEASNLNLHDSIHAPKTGSRSRGIANMLPPGPLSFQNTFTPLAEKPPSTRSSPSPTRSTGADLIDSIVTRFRDNYRAEVKKGNQRPPGPDIRSNKMRPRKVTFTDEDKPKTATQVFSTRPDTAVIEESSKAPNTKANTSTKVALNREEPDNEDVVAATKAVSSALERNSVNKGNKAEIAPGKRLETPRVVSEGTDSEHEEDRDNLTHFKSWGTPIARDKPASRVRKVILSGLPSTSDLTLVQGLISGGAIETYILSASKETAYVTFTTGEACDNFFDEYPNGLPFKYDGRNYTAFVDKGQDVDVVSGMLHCYLNCGATRVIRATGADEDWGMRALYKLAGGKDRKVEAIFDSYRNEIRTVVFRFTNIVDAVAFRGELIRDEDWEMCNIQFMDDPCEKATGVHVE